MVTPEGLRKIYGIFKQILRRFGQGDIANSLYAFQESAGIIFGADNGIVMHGYGDLWLDAFNGIDGLGGGHHIGA